MKNLWVGILFVAALGFGALAQKVFTAKANAEFEPVAFIGSSGNAVTNAPALQVMSIEMSDGATCYVLTGAGQYVQLEALSQMLGLGCVR